MLDSKRILFTGFAMASLLCGAALADSGNGNTTGPVPTPTQTGKTVKFECRFEGGSSDKSGGWFQKCRGEGTITKAFDNTPVILDGSDDGHLKIVCDNGGDDDSMDDGDVIYDDGLRVRFNQDDRTLALKGIKGECPPVILVTLGDRDENRSFPADLSFTRHDFSYDIGGRCRFEKEGNNPPPSAQ